MTGQEIIEGAKLISRFMSESKEPYNETGDFVTYNGIDSEGDYFDYRNMKYHTSWDWLMPSWGKLSSLLLAKSEFELIEEFKNAVVKNNIDEAWNIIVKGIQVINE